MALAQRRDGKDVVSLFGTSQWEPDRTFGVATHDLADLRWGPGSDLLCVVDSLLEFQERRRRHPRRIPKGAAVGMPSFSIKYKA